VFLSISSVPVHLSSSVLQRYWREWVGMMVFAVRGRGMLACLARVCGEEGDGDGGVHCGV
jgi:hypothetical protein